VFQRSRSALHHDSVRLHRNLGLVRESDASVAGAPTAPAPLYVDGTRTVYADNGTNQTEATRRSQGWTRASSSPELSLRLAVPNGQLYVIPDSPYTFSASLLSDGISSEYRASHGQRRTVGFLSGFPNQGAVSISSDGCGTSVSPGASCAYVVTYDPTTIQCTRRLRV